jgi:hypothetical protein
MNDGQKTLIDGQRPCRRQVREGSDGRAIQSTRRVTELCSFCDSQFLAFAPIEIYQRSNSTLQHEGAEVCEHDLSSSIRQLFDREHRCLLS